MIFSIFQKNHVFGYSWATLLWYRCYYPHRSRDALSPVRGIFHEGSAKEEEEPLIRLHGAVQFPPCELVEETGDSFYCPQSTEIYNTHFKQPFEEKKPITFTEESRVFIST